MVCFELLLFTAMMAFTCVQKMCLWTNSRTASLKGWVFMTVLGFDIKVALHMLTRWWMVFRGWWLHMDRKLKVLMSPVYIKVQTGIIAGISCPHTKTKCLQRKWDGGTVPRPFGKSLKCSYTSAIIHYTVLYLYFRCSCCLLVQKVVNWS